jgi:hypothetical protein
VSINFCPNCVPFLLTIYTYVEIQGRLDGQILVCYQDKILTPQDAPPLAAKLRDQLKDLPAHPALWKEPPPPKPPRVDKRKKRYRKYIGPLTGDTHWTEDLVRRNKHSELTKAGMERARQAGKQIGTIPVEERAGFAEKFMPVLTQLEQKAITRKQAARALGISVPTLKRILDGQPTPTRQKPIVDGERVAIVV